MFCDPAAICTQSANDDAAVKVVCAEVENVGNDGSGVATNAANDERSVTDDWAARAATVGRRPVNGNENDVPVREKRNRPSTRICSRCDAT